MMVPWAEGEEAVAVQVDPADVAVEQLIIADPTVQVGELVDGVTLNKFQVVLAVPPA
jgi:hypothetical protein